MVFTCFRCDKSGLISNWDKGTKGQREDRTKGRRDDGTTEPRKSNAWNNVFVYGGTRDDGMKG